MIWKHSSSNDNIKSKFVFVVNPPRKWQYIFLSVYYETLLILYHRLLCSRPNAQIKIQYLLQILLTFAVQIYKSHMSNLMLFRKVCSLNFEPPAESPEQMQSVRNYGSFLSKSHLHGVILFTMLAQNRPKSRRQCVNRAICYFKIVNIKQGEATAICLRSNGKC